MKIINKLVSILIVLSLILPAIADAKAGSRIGGGYRGAPSSGYRGYHSAPSSNYNYRPSSNRYQSRSAYQQPYQGARNYSGGTSGFFSGLFSGILGAWLYNKLSGTNQEQPAAQSSSPESKPVTQNQTPSGQENSGFLRIIIILLAAYVFWRYLKRRRGANDRSKQFDTPSINQNKGLKDFINLAHPTSQDNVVSLTQNDQNAFENLLINIQNAWSNYDLDALRGLTTLEMYQNFESIINENRERGIQNHIKEVRLLNQKLQGSWQEGGSDYARVALTWSAIDYAINAHVSPNDPDYLIEGNQTQPTVATEVWTFTRSPSGPWSLAQIQ